VTATKNCDYKIKREKEVIKKGNKKLVKLEKRYKDKKRSNKD
jgi:hypothetical protein